MEEEEFVSFLHFIVGESMSVYVQSCWILHNESCQNCTPKSYIPSAGKGVETCVTDWQSSCREGSHL